MSEQRDVVTVVARPWEHGLELHVAGVGVTQTHDAYPETAEEMVRDLVSIMRDVPADSFDVIFTASDRVESVTDAIKRLGVKTVAAALTAQALAARLSEENRETTDETETSAQPAPVAPTDRRAGGSGPARGGQTPRDLRDDD